MSGARPAGLFDLRLHRHPDGGLRSPGAATSVQPADLAATVRETGGRDCDVRIMLDDGGRDVAFFTELADALDHDVLITPSGSVLRQGVDPGPDAVPVDPRTGAVVDWQAVQPARPTAKLPGWFDLSGGRVRARDGVAVVSLPDGLIFTSRRDFVTDRASAGALRLVGPQMTTIGVTTVDGLFRLCDYTGGQESADAEGLAVMLDDLPLYGGDLRLWLSWPTGRRDRHTLGTQLRGLAELIGATVWAPPVAGSAVLLPGPGDLGARSLHGEPAEWVAHRPSAAPVALSLRSDHDGRLVAAAAVAPAAATAPRLQRRARTGSGSPLARRDRTGLEWLPTRTPVIDRPLLLHVRSPWPAARVVLEGLPSAGLHVVGREDDPVPTGSGHVVLVAVPPGVAVPGDAVAGKAPEPLSALLRGLRRYLIPAGLLDRVQLTGGYLITADGTRGETVDLPARPLMLRLAGAGHGVDGLPDGMRTWPPGRSRRLAYALETKSAAVAVPISGHLALRRAEPAPLPGHRLHVRFVEPGQALDVAATAADLAPLTSVRSLLPDLLASGTELLLPGKAAAAVADEVYEAGPHGWVRSG